MESQPTRNITRTNGLPQSGSWKRRSPQKRSEKCSEKCNGPALFGRCAVAGAGSGAQMPRLPHRPRGTHAAGRARSLTFHSNGSCTVEAATANDPEETFDCAADLPDAGDPLQDRSRLEGVNQVDPDHTSNRVEVESDTSRVDEKTISKGRINTKPPNPPITEVLTRMAGSRSWSCRASPTRPTAPCPPVSVVTHGVTPDDTPPDRSASSPAP
jgi:hypothetical protein